MEVIRDRQLLRVGISLAAAGLLAGSAGAQRDAWYKVDELRPTYGWGGMQHQSHFGTSVSLLGHRALVGSEGLQGGVGCAYLYRQEGEQWFAWAELEESIPEPGSDFGVSVALGEDFALVGAPEADGGAGALYVFEERYGVWGEVARLQRVNRTSTDHYASALAVSGRRALVSTPGMDQVHVYDQVSGVWRQTAVLTPASQGGVQAKHKEFGAALAFDGTVAVVGAPEAGEVHLFVPTPTGWSRGPVLAGPSGLDDFGASVALSGDTLLVGAPDDTGKGRVVVYERDGLGNWSESTRLKPVGLPSTLVFGTAVDVDGRRAVVGAPDTQSILGHALVYERFEGQWVQNGELVPDVAPGEGRYGTAVAIQGDLCMVNVGLDDSGVIGYVGAVHVWLSAENVHLTPPRPDPAGN